ncbi:long-chain fatty acid--CoA ligase [Scrofimicrobium sp. R131]|uniref:Acyl-CoA synthetase n=1 Tax=Scrofimicrobium appendicitidis TaxID=3079930 RepID=A0AAU7VBF7_9ACTO
MSNENNPSADDVSEDSPVTEALEWTGPVLERVDEHLSIPALLERRVSANPRSPIIELKSEMGATWRPIYAGDFWREVQAVAAGLIGMGLEFGDRFAIMSHTRYEWTLLDFAGWTAGLAPVPIYETSSASQIAYILQDAEVKLVVAESISNANLVRAAAEQAGVSVQVLSLDSQAIATITEAGRTIPVTEVTARANRLTTDSLATLVYTSGTTGTPKGVVINHGNFTELTVNSYLWMPEVASHPKSRLLLFLPLAHILARFLQVYQVCSQGVLGHSPDIKNLLPDLASFRPSYLLVVPRVLEKIYNSADASTGSGVKNRMFRWAANTAVEYSKALDTEEGPSRALATQHKLASALVLSKIINLVGGNAEFVISGGAPLSEHLSHFYRGAGLPVLEGYGLTETTGPISVNTPRLNKIGTVGPPLPPMSVRISDDGEVLVKGSSVFQGYLHNQELTDQVLKDGWFATGDLGSLDRDGYLRITGRAKEVIVTAGGKNVIPSALEDELRGHPLISQIVVVGDKRPFISALITLDTEMLPLWLKNKGLPALSAAEAIENIEVRASLDRAIARTNEKVSRAESIRKFEILPTDLTEANGMLTPSLKVKRSVVLREFADVIDRIYGGPVEY